MKWKILHIYEDDYGCEGIPEDGELMCSVLARNAGGEEKWLKIADKWLTDNEVTVGSVFIFGSLFISLVNTLSKDCSSCLELSINISLLSLEDGASIWGSSKFSFIGVSILLFSCIASILTPQRFAIFDNVSPSLTIICIYFSFCRKW